METLKINYNQVSQIATYFRSIENANDLTFSQRRRLMRLNDELEKEFNYFTHEIQKLADLHCEKDDNGEFVKTEGGGQKIKDDSIDIVSKALNEIYGTETEIHYQPFKLNEKYFENLKCDTQTIKLIEDAFLEEEEEA